MNLLLIGGAGRMGTMFRRRFAAAGHIAAVLDLEEGEPGLRPERLAQALPQARAVILCVPWSAVEETARQAAAFMRPDQPLLDICSVKVLPMRSMEAAFGGPVVGTHPLFGPEPAPQDNRIALTPGKNARDADLALADALFRSIGCETFVCAADEHDAASARIQSLNFASSAAYFALLSGHDGVERFLTPSCVRHKEAARKMLTRDAAMFREFTEANPFFPGAVREFQALLGKAADGGLEGLARDAAGFYGG